MFKRLCLLGILSIGAFVGPAVAQDREALQWGEAGDWRIYADSTGNGCFAMQTFRDGTVFRLGFDARRKRPYMFLGGTSWEADDGGTYTVRFVFDQAASHEIDLEGVDMGDRVVALVHRGLSADFMRDLLKATDVRLYHDGEPFAQFSPRNAQAALAQVTK